MKSFKTQRLTIRSWIEADLAPFVKMGQDREVMRYFPKLLTEDESKEMMLKINLELQKDGYGYWALEEQSTGDFIGFVALAKVGFTAHFTPAFEIGWRLRRSSWGQGYATESAQRVLQFAFEELGLKQVVALTARINQPSRDVMRRLGMTYDPEDDFIHPWVGDHPELREHILCRMDRP